MEIMDILSVEGIVVRRVPLTTRSCYRVYPTKDGCFRPLADDESFITDVKTHPVSGATHRVVERITKNALKRYIITISADTGSMVRFSLKSSGIGDTIQDAYEDFLIKNGGGASNELLL